MIRSDHLWKGIIIISCLCTLPQFYGVTEGRRYDKCTTQDGRQGVCVVKRYCREASNQPLLPCESDEENHCCPIPTTHRSADIPRPWDEEQRPAASTNLDRDRRPAVLPESDKDGRRPTVAKESGRDDQRSEIYRPSDRDDRFTEPVKDDRQVPTRYNRDNPPSGEHKASDSDDRQVPERFDRDNPRSDVRRGYDSNGDHAKDDRQAPERFNRGNSRSGERRETSKDDRVRGSDHDRPGSIGSGREDNRPGIYREPDRDDRVREPIREDRRPDVPKEYPREQRRPEVYRESDRDDRLNKTPPPADRRSPTRHNVDRPRTPLETDRAEDPYEAPRRRPQSSQGYPKEGPPADRERDAGIYNRPPPSRADPPPPRRADGDRFYPSRDELDRHRNTEPPRRLKPDRRDDTRESAKAPIRFPDPHDVPASRPKVPACGVKPYELFIAGGTESDEHEWPWMTAIFRRHPDSRPKTFLCGGSLINTKYVLTAAHCFVNNYVVLPASAFVVRLGSHYLNSGEEYTVANVVIHNNHSGSDFFNDIALVRLASEVYITDKIAPICLPPYPEMLDEDLVGRMATVAGWGDTSFRSAGTRTLQHVVVPIVSGEDCFASYSRVRGAAFLARGSDHVICAGLKEGGKDACLGDSGGPLMMKLADDRWVIVGIVSLGYKCAEPGYPGVYTRVTHYMGWIMTNMKRH